MSHWSNRARRAMAAARQNKRIESKSDRTIIGCAQGNPLSKRYGDNQPDIPDGRPRLKRFRCRTADLPYVFGAKEPVRELRAHYGDAVAIKRPDGRKLCPHRKVDLSQFLPDADGLVTCPLHGLRVRCTELAA